MMRLSLAVFAVLSLLVPIFASPLPLEGEANAKPSALVERQTAARTCGATTYSVQAQDQAFNFAMTQDILGLTVTSSNDGQYPHNYYNTDKLDLPECPGVPGPFREFPILSAGYIFTDGEPAGPDRIVYKVTGTAPVNNLPDQFAYCGVMTHTGAARNKFLQCN